MTRLPPEEMNVDRLDSPEPPPPAEGSWADRLDKRLTAVEIRLTDLERAVGGLPR